VGMSLKSWFCRFGLAIDQAQNLINDRFEVHGLWEMEDVHLFKIKNIYTAKHNVETRPQLLIQFKVYTVLKY
jgi:hypothetical protein